LLFFCTKIKANGRNCCTWDVYVPVISLVQINHILFDFLGLYLQILSKLLVWDSQKIRAGADQHPFKWLLNADRRLHHRLGSERENFESSLSGTAVSAPSDI